VVWQAQIAFIGSTNNLDEKRSHVHAVSNLFCSNVMRINVSA
jgi:hypothetical protein